METTPTPTPDTAPAKPETRPLRRAAQIVSDVFSPMLAPTYCMAMAMWITPLQILPERTRMGATLGVAIITAAIPMALLLLLFRAGRISDMCISRRRERTVPMIVAVLAYIGAAIYLGVLHAPSWLCFFFFGAAAATLTAMLVNLWWKISAHGIAIGGMAGMMLWLTASGLATVNAMLWLTAVIIIGGMVGSARLVLERHTPAQVVAGWLLGVVSVFVFMCI